MNLIGHFRSNYFSVKDRVAFEEWCQQNGLQLVVQKSNTDLVGFLNSNNEAGIPSTVVEEKDGVEQDIDIDFIGELKSFLADGHVAIVIEITYEGSRYIGGTAHAINHKDERRRIDLEDIMIHANALGDHVTKCEY